MLNSGFIGLGVLKVLLLVEQSDQLVWLVFQDKRMEQQILRSVQSVQLVLQAGWLVEVESQVDQLEE